MGMFRISPVALEHGTIGYSFSAWFTVCSCAFKRKGILNSKLFGLHRTGFKIIRILLSASGDLN